jgi:hypothetical protein
MTDQSQSPGPPQAQPPGQPSPTEWLKQIYELVGLKITIADVIATVGAGGVSAWFAPTDVLCVFMAVGAVMGGILGYVFTAVNWKNVAAETRKRRAVWLLVRFILGVVLLIFTLATIGVGWAELSTTIATIRRVLIAEDIVINALIAIEAGLVVYHLVAMVTILSPSLKKGA